MTYIMTSTGRPFSPIGARPTQIHIEDIAHHLANLCRFTGAVREFYSVAQHSVHVSQYVPATDALWGLLHDATEAYIGDMNRPLKHCGLMFEYRSIEADLADTIAERFGLPFGQPTSVTEADNRMLMTEKRDLMPEASPEWAGLGVHWPAFEPYQFRIIPWTPAMAKQAFLQRYAELTR